MGEESSTTKLGVSGDPSSEKLRSRHRLSWASSGADEKIDLFSSECGFHSRMRLRFDKTN